MNLFVLGLRRSGTTILYDALREDPGLRCFYEPLREDAETIGGGSGARDEDVFAETRAERERFRAERYPELPIELFNWGGPRAPELELEPELPEHCRELLVDLLDQAPDVAIKETRLHHKLGGGRRDRPRARRSCTWSATRARSPPRCCSAAGGAPTSTPTPTPSSPPAPGAGCGRAGGSPRR